MGFLSSLFGKKEAPKRQLDHPSKLNKGDMISLDDSFALPPQLRGQQLRVEAVNTYEYQRKQQTEWVLKGHGNDTIFLSLDEDDETYLGLSIKLNRGLVEALFDLDQFSEIFEESGKAQLTTNTLTADLEDYEQWLSPHYHQVSAADFGYFHRQDYRGQRPPQDADGATGDAFEAYQLLDDDEDKAIDVEVYEGGDTDVMLTIYRPLSDIRDYWPGA
ncbi:hypothetical protein [Shewanella fidelis]|uniref:DUF4178 domain-containing protein n=1 Tax=Shewanella fidelis TaxID=173509 RepID=A0AAW8NKK9_9GAMM|nr:hypothetical protein [Shewanella fidelis]MDR8522438.1 hypothetical protein [Shewanella fidelis]MDW4813028.1 hypothetical protein [Shewanella fidelis]MDW4816713.1 hypothetical protein [Shewanella fidelis]MDW4821035.1 hypothetical protein [Shewanella fidelis]MDW4825430.1 hypothetical protein [Shewanella fidelis]